MTASEAWSIYYGSGWNFTELPSKRDSFIAGFEAARQSEVLRPTIFLTKDETALRIAEWQAKFAEME